MGLSTHILDTALGRPAPNVAIKLSEFRDNAAGGAWHEIGSARTDADGRCKTLLGDKPLAAGDYKLHFDTAVYFYDRHLTSLYPYVEIVFTVANPGQHYHIPLLLTANGYTTYRGS
ncbi:MAG TPA: hydroxyisourate hydrolase [Acidobacteriaceae bacterium]|nr:hydroxyisourate hydrolase [Acidobacteriaceae bacterium]